MFVAEGVEANEDDRDFGDAIGSRTSICRSTDLTRKPMVVAGLCVKIGEETSGAYKFCRYNCPGGLYEMEIKPSERCPASLDR